MPRQALSLVLAASTLGLAGCSLPLFCPQVTEADEALVESQDPALRASVEAQIHDELDALREQGQLEARTEVRCEFEVRQRPECRIAGWYCEVEVFAVDDVDLEHPMGVDFVRTGRDRSQISSAPLAGCADPGSRCRAELGYAEATQLAVSACAEVDADDHLEPRVDWILRRPSFEWDFLARASEDAPIHARVAIDPATREVECVPCHVMDPDEDPMAVECSSPED